MRSCISLIILALTATAVEAGSYPFEGAWAGGPATCDEAFRFTSTTYRIPAGRLLRVEKVERNGNWFRLQFAGGKNLTLASVGADSMTWHSPASGDTFDLRRCKVR